MKNKTLKIGDWTEEKVRAKILKSHEQENEYNSEIGSIDKQVKGLKFRKQRLTKLVSKNMKYRNLIVTFLPTKK